MRLYLLTVFSLLSFMPLQSMALEPVNEAHAMFYYQVPFSANKPEEKKHSFGFRMDHASFEQGDMIQYNQLMTKTAAFDFKLGHKGVESMSFGGVDYLKLYRLNKAA